MDLDIIRASLNAHVLTTLGYTKTKGSIYRPKTRKQPSDVI